MFSDVRKAASRGAADRGEYREAGGAIAEAVTPRTFNKDYLVDTYDAVPREVDTRRIAQICALRASIKRKDVRQLPAAPVSRPGPFSPPPIRAATDV